MEIAKGIKSLAMLAARFKKHVRYIDSIVPFSTENEKGTPTPLTMFFFKRLGHRVDHLHTF